MTTATVYRWVVDDVIAKIKPEVVQEGLDESVLDELRSLWETKLQAKGLLSDDPGPSMPYGVHPQPNLNNRPPGFSAGLPPGAAASLVNNPAALAILAQAQQALMQQQLKRQQPEGGFAGALAQPVKRQEGGPHWGGGAPGAGGSGVVPQRDGAADEDEEGEEQGAASAGAGAAGAGPSRGIVPQRDGDGDEEEEEQEQEQDQGEAQERNDEILSSDSEEDEEEEDIENFMCAQFEKVTRTKNRWKIAVREGVFHIHGKDYLFKKATGEWIF